MRGTAVITSSIWPHESHSSLTSPTVTSQSHHITQATCSGSRSAVRAPARARAPTRPRSGPRARGPSIPSYPAAAPRACPPARPCGAGAGARRSGVRAAMARHTAADAPPERAPAARTAPAEPRSHGWLPHASYVLRVCRSMCLVTAHASDASRPDHIDAPTVAWKLLAIELLRLLRLLRPFGIITCHQERLPVTGVGRPGIVKL